MSTKFCSDCKLPYYSQKEELLNFLTHIIGAVASVAFFIVLLRKFFNIENGLLGMCVFGLSLEEMYCISATYHILKFGNLKRIFRKLDHCSIFFLIAGTYTPICLILLNNTQSNIVLGFVYTIAVAGIVLNSVDVSRFSKISMVLYILMGWSIVFISKSALRVFSDKQVFWLFMGGIIYTLGAVIYLLGQKIPYMHCVWHIFVLMGSLCHILIFLV